MSRQSIITLPKWLAASNNAATAPATVVYIGSSTTAGTAASARSRRFENLLDTKLRLRSPSVTATHDYYNISAENNTLVDGLYSVTGTVTQDYQGLGSQTYALASGATMGLTATGRWYTIYFVEGPNYLPFAYSIDGGSDVTVTPSTANPDNRHTGSVTFDAGSEGSHTIRVTATNACKINGIMTHTGSLTSGYYYYNSGIGGARSGDYSFRIPWLMPRLNTLNPHLIVYMVGSNDFSTLVSISAYKTNVQDFITAVRAQVSSNPDILLVQPYARFDVPSPVAPWSAYGTALQEIARDNTGCFYVDISRHYPDSQAHDAADLISADNIHQTDAGYSLMARELYAALT